MRDWVVAGGLVEGPDGILLVQNRRRDGSLDWSPPGGVIEVVDGESVRDGLTREVREETGLRVLSWDGPVYRVEAVAADMGWRLRAEVHLATAFEGRLAPADPDGIVVDARFVAPDRCHEHLAGCHPWVAEPFGAWLAERWSDARRYRYVVTGTRESGYRVVRR